MLKDLKRPVMSTVFIILTIVIVAIILSGKIQTIGYRIEGLRKEINKLRENLLEIQTRVPEEQPQPVEEVVPPVPEPAPVETPQPEPEPIAEPELIVEEIPAPQPAIVSPAPEPRPQAAPSPKRRKVNYEKLIGENLFGKIGILILVAGVGLFIKYAIDNAWINETMRTILGFLVGFSLLFIAERLHRKYRTFSSLLAGGAFAMFYITVAVAYHYYGLFSQTAAFILLILITIFMSVLALIYDRRELAAIAITGGFLAPFLVSSGEGNYITLFTYIFILNCGMFALSIYKKWGELPLISFVLTWLCMLVYVFNSWSSTTVSGFLLLFATGFFLQFLFPVVLVLKDSHSRLNKSLLAVVPLNNFIYMGFGLRFLTDMNIGVKLNGILTLAIALINLGIALWIKKQNRENLLLLYTFIALAVTFVSISIPLQLDGNYITIFWAAEMVLLLYLSIRSGYKVYEYFSYVIATILLLSWRLGFPLWTDTNPDALIFLNGQFFTNLFAGLCFLTYAFLIRKYKMPSESKKYTPINTIALSIGCILLWYAVYNEFQGHIENYALANISTYLFSACYLFALSIVLRKRYAYQNFIGVYLTGAAINAAVFTLTFLTSGGQWTTSPCALWAWLYWLVVMAHLFYISRVYYTLYNYRTAHDYTIALNSTVTLLTVFATWLFLNQISSGENFSAGFSICLAIIGFIQMLLGMKLHFRLLRSISLITFGIILLKLLAYDLWRMPAVGKIIVFILLGIILLLLSFMYQKLKNVLFKEDEQEE